MDITPGKAWRPLFFIILFKFLYIKNIITNTNFLIYPIEIIINYKYFITNFYHKLIIIIILFILLINVIFKYYLKFNILNFHISINFHLLDFITTFL